METNLVFVYGSLKSGCYNHRVLNGAALISDAARTVGKYRMYCNGGFPAIAPTDRDDLAGSPAQGELYSVSDATLARLDQLEANGRMYQRREVGIATPEGHVNAWVYEWIDAEGLTARRGWELCPNGHWADAAEDAEADALLANS